MSSALICSYIYLHIHTIINFPKEKKAINVNRALPHEVELIVRLTLLHCVIRYWSTTWIELKPTSAHRRRHASPIPASGLPHFRWGVIPPPPHWKMRWSGCCRFLLLLLPRLRQTALLQRRRDWRRLNASHVQGLCPKKICCCSEISTSWSRHWMHPQNGCKFRRQNKNLWTDLGYGIWENQPQLVYSRFCCRDRNLRT